MPAWLDVAVVSIIVLIAVTYAVYSLGPKRIKNAYSRFATKYFGLRAAKWFAPSKHDSCSNCPGNEDHKH